MHTATGSNPPLNEPVQPYKIKSLGKMPAVGTAADLKAFYRENLVAEDGKLVIGKVEVTTASEVTAVLRALLYTGCCRIEERSRACRDVFLRACKAGTYIGIEELLGSFVEKDDNPFVGVLQDTIRELVTKR